MMSRPGDDDLGVDRTTSQVVAEALEKLEEEQFWRDVAVGWARLRADPEAWAEELAERRQWESLPGGSDAVGGTPGQP